MCGIVGYTGFRQAASVLMSGLTKLEYRGYDSAGIAIHAGSGFAVIKTRGRLMNLKKKIDEQGVPEGGCGIGHTRWATHGEPSDVNSHPHCSDNVVLVHNGIIENYLELKNFLTYKGYSFLSETDTEVAAKLFNYYYNGDPVSSINATLEKIKGSYAFGILFRDRPGEVYAVRKDSPLIVGLGQGENFIASDIPAILSYTREYCLLDEREIALLTPEGVTVYDVYGRPVKKEKIIATFDIEAAEKGGYPHFMLKEIFEQPKALRDTISTKIADGLPSFALKGLRDADFARASCIHIVACGTAMHAGMIGKTVMEHLARVPVLVDIASEFRYRNPIFAPNDLVVIISQSGETADTLAALRLAKQNGIKTLAVVNVLGSSIAREADEVVYTLAGPEIAVASTKAYSVQVAVMYLLAIKLALCKGVVGEEEARALTAQLSAIPDLVTKVLENTEICQQYASYYQNKRDLFFLGRGMDYALSLEGSLKLKEISYMHSEAYAAGELKHGTISLIYDDTPVVALATQHHLYEKMVSNIKEVKTRGARVLLICSHDSPHTEDIADHVIRIPEVNDLFAPLPAIVPLQLFAYYTAVLRGCDVDKPRNLAKSVTVE